jgi:hypothetical protein
VGIVSKAGRVAFAQAFRQAAHLVMKMAVGREDMMCERPWPPTIVYEIRALENAAAMLNQIALGYECTLTRPTQPARGKERRG